MSNAAPMLSPAYVRHTGLLLGPVLFALILLLPAPDGLSFDGQAALATASLLAVWWMTEALPIPVTSLLPILLFPLLGIMSMQEAAAPYADQLIFLFLGGFILAIAVERSGLHRRIALHVIRLAGGGPAQLVLGFMLATAALSMWISNTATVMLMLPIALAVLKRVQTGEQRVDSSRFSVTLLLGIAYAASIGGTATLIGTPPNIVLAGVMRSLYPSGPEIGFVQWMLFGVPLAIVFLPLVWIFLIRILPTTRLDKRSASETDHNAVHTALAALGPLSTSEKRVMAVFTMTACGWVFRLPIDTGLFRTPGITDVLPQVTDATIAVMASVVLFFLPAGKNSRLLDWKDVQQTIPWGILLLFGGGFSLAEAMRRSGVTLFLGSGIENMGIIPVFLIIALVCLLLSFLTELTSNTATANILLPVLASASVALGHHPLLLALPAALNASFAFMLPVATPPNAIVFSTSLIGIRTMAATGLTFNFLGVLLVTMMMYLLGLHVFDITIASTPAWVQ